MLLFVSLVESSLYLCSFLGIRLHPLSSDAPHMVMLLFLCVKKEGASHNVLGPYKGKLL